MPFYKSALSVIFFLLLIPAAAPAEMLDPENKNSIRDSILLWFKRLIFKQLNEIIVNKFIITNQLP